MEKLLVFGMAQLAFVCIVGTWLFPLIGQAALVGWSLDTWLGPLLFALVGALALWLAGQAANLFK